MADVSITATEVIASTAEHELGRGIAGAAVTAGQAVYMDSTDLNKLKLAMCDGTAAQAACVGLAAHGAAAGQPLTYQHSGTIVIGSSASIAEGAVYTLTDTPGGIAAHADADDPVSTEFTTLIGVGDGSDGIILRLLASGQQTA